MFDQEEEFEDEFTEQFKTFKPSYVLIAIDTDSSMFKLRKEVCPDGSRETYFQNALYASYKVANALVLSTGVRNYNDFGVVLVDTNPKKAMLVEVKTNMLEKVKILHNEYNKPTQEILTQYRRNDKIDLAEFFRMCRRKLKEIDEEYYRHTIIFVTNDENPIRDDPQLKLTVMNEAISLEASEIRLELVSMRKNFDYTKFWNEFFNRFQNPPRLEEFCADRIGLRRRLKNTVIYRYTPLKCKLFPFKNDFQKHLQCKRVKFIRPAKLYNTNRMSKDGKLVMRVKSEEAPFAPQYRVNLGHTELEHFDVKERYDVYYNNLPLGLHLQYVSDRETQVGVTVGRPGLLMMDDKEELSHFYDNFWSYCVDNNKVLMCLKKYKHPSAIRYVELIPKFANNQKMFLVKNLPFVEEILYPNKVTERLLKRQAIRSPTGNQLQAVRDLMTGLTSYYEPRMLYNVSYSKKKRYLKAKFLDMPYVDPGDCAGDMSAMNEELGKEMRAVRDLFGFNSGTGEKRKAAGPSNARAKRGRK